MSDRHQPNNNNRNTNNRRGRGGGGRGRGRSGGRGRGRSGGQQQEYAWTSGSGGGGGNHNPNSPQGQWTSGNEHNEPEIFPTETQSGLLFGLSDQVIVPGSVNHALLQGEILETLKRMPPYIVNLMLNHFDKCAREGGIRNKNAYMLGIINSGPRMGLPSGVVVPASVKFSLMQGVVLEDLTVLPVPLINSILGEFDTEMRQRGNTVHDRYSFLAEIIRKHKQSMPAGSAAIGAAALPPSSHHPQANSSNNNGHHPQANNNRNNGHNQHIINNQMAAAAAAHNNNNNNIKQEGNEMDDTLALLSNSMERVRLLTESVAKVTTELVAEKEKRNTLEAICKSEQVLREATDARFQTAVSELGALQELRTKETADYQTSIKFEKDRRVAIDKEIIDLNEKVKTERAEKNRAEDRLSALEDLMIAEREVRDIERNGPDALPDINSNEFDQDFDSDDEAK